MDCKTQSGSRAVGTVGQSGNYLSRAAAPRTLATGAAEGPRFGAHCGQMRPGHAARVGQSGNNRSRVSSPLQNEGAGKTLGSSETSSSWAVRPSPPVGHNRRSRACTGTRTLGAGLGLRPRQVAWLSLPDCCPCRTASKHPPERDLPPRGMAACGRGSHVFPVGS